MKKFKFVMLPLAALVTTTMAMAAEQSVLDAIEVNASAYDISRVSAAKIQVRQASLMRDVLRDIPGVNIAGTTQQLQRIYMRGLNDQAVNITIDGARQIGNNFHHNGDLLVDPALLKRVDVTVGSNSITDGAGSLSGSVKMTTIDPSDMLVKGQRFAGRAKLSYATNNKEFQPSLTLAGRLSDQLEVLGYYSYRDYERGKRGKITNQYDSDKRMGGDGHDHNFLVKAVAHLTSEQKVTLSAEGLKFSGLFPFRPEFGKHTGLTDIDQKRHTYTLGYEYNPAENDYINFKANAYYTKHHLQWWPNDKYKINSTYDVSFITKGVTLDNISMIETGPIIQTLKVGYEFYIARNHANAQRASSICADRLDQNGNTTTKALNDPVPPICKNSKSNNEQLELNVVFGNNGEKATSHSFYVEDAIHIGNITIRPGVRFDHYEINYLQADRYPAAVVDANSKANYARDLVKSQRFNHFSKALGINYDFDSNVSVYANYTELFRAPHLVEAIRLTNSDWVQTEKVKPETGRNYEAGASYNRSHLLDRYSDALSLSAKYFHTKYDNLIAHHSRPSDVGSGINSSRRNLGQADVKGVELMARYGIENVDVSLGYTHTSVDYKQKYKAVKKGSALYGAAVTPSALTGDKFTLGVGYTFADDFYVNWNSLFMRKLNANSYHSEKPGYAVHDIALSWTPSSANLKGLEATIGVYNLFNKGYISHTAKEFFNSTVKENMSLDFEPGRNIKLGLSYKF